MFQKFWMRTLNKTSNIAGKIPCVIIDDDPFIRDLLVDKLLEYFPEIEVIGIATDGNDGIQKLTVLRPELIFLDVEMSDMTGFEMLSKLPRIDFRIIFITSYRHYAIKAIRFNALDYLLKPFDLEEMKNAISRFKDQIKKPQNQDSIHLALANLSTPNVKDQILSLNTQDGLLKIAIKDIVHIQGDRNYSCIYMSNQKKELVSKTLADLEEILSDKNFFRCHKSHLVNKVHIRSSNIEGNSLTLSSGLILPISRRRRHQFSEWFGQNNSVWEK